MLQLTTAIDLGPGEEMYKMTGQKLYLSKIFRQVGLINVNKLASLIRDYTVCAFQKKVILKAFMSDFNLLI